MKISVERLPDCKARLTAEIPAETANAERKGIVAAYAAQAKLPGFRPGKIPTSVVEKKFGAEIDSELKDRLARKAYAEAREKEKLEILGIAKVEKDQLESDGSFTMEVEVVTEPEVEIKNYKEIPVELTKMEITDEMVNGFIDNMRKQKAEPKDTDRASAAGDILVANYTATLDGEPLADKLEQEAGPLAAGEDHWIELPEEGEQPREFIPGLAAGCVGMAPGDTRTIEAEFPEDFPIEPIAGKTVSYEVTANTVKERELPPLDEEFAKGLGLESVEALKEAVTAQYEQQQANMRNEIIDNQILGYLNEEATFDLPEHIVFNETQRQVNEMVTRGYQQGVAHEEIEANQEQLLQSAETQAKNNVKTMFILDQIAENEGIQVTEEETTQRIVQMAMQAQRPVKKFARELRDNNKFGEIRQDILISKTIEFLRSNATITEVDPPEEKEEEKA